MVFISGAAGCFVDLCYFYQTQINSSGPTGCTAILVNGTSEPRVTNTNIAEFDYGITIQGNGGSPGNLVHALFSNLACECATTAVTIIPGDSDHQVCEVFFTGCVFERAHHSTNSTPGVLINVYEDGDSSTVSDIFFENCMSHDWAGPGVQIAGGQDISIIGGRYGQNATAASATTSGAIAVTGAAVRVRVVGANCTALIPAYKSQPTADNAQPYSISVTGAVTGMQVEACDLTANAAGALYVPTDGTDLRVTDCVGYNDQTTIVTSASPSTPFSGSGYGYYGPVTFYATGSSLLTLSIGGHALPFDNGTFTLGPRASASYTVEELGHGWTGFAMIGQ
jgi:hypothetical protein